MTKIYESFANPGIEHVSEILNLKHELLQCDWLIGKTTKREGLDKYDFGLAPNGFSYDDLAACSWPMHLNTIDPAPLITIPKDYSLGRNMAAPVVIIHELGHVLHHHISYEYFAWIPTSQYGSTNCWENFTENFTAWLMPNETQWNAVTGQWEQYRRPCEQAVALFESLKLLRAN